MVYPEDAKLERSMLLAESSFGKQSKKLKSLSLRMEQLGVSCSSEEVKELGKRLLFEEKAMLEKEQNFQKYLQKKEKKKHMKEELRKVHSNVLRDDVDFDKVEEAPITLKEIKESSDVAMLEDNY